MIQNTGELMMYLGGALVLAYPIGVLIINILHSSTKGRFRPTSTMGIVLGLCVVAGIVLMFVGDSYRKDISKDVMVSYYEKNIPYEDLTKAQRKNIDASLININKMRRSGEDVSKYLPALEKYMYEFYIYEGIPEKDAKSYIESMAK
ncbi:hypothetical protein QJV03_10000 [Listeria swaminathanii]|uniref:DUF4190 domain-containing protein n=1 Tax=Listeria swaminathanii TaxID=2713501 RepID=A0ABU2IGI4_9LIST|nr:hypothetical protein [Listeria swaminathanii]MDT0017513.1 hypothetical protein [Listeria swaminathanii]MDT0022602.1 hypothetical protein [Listeria swaminathanii]MDT0033566.1 hypothetical protein [Listeria swaminathanii]MDT0052482.1 hypothetical protein [Listeria swaminathanii]MDT0055247.1 hypothetical protein [Listeria swaminathanii]